MTRKNAKRMYSAILTRSKTIEQSVEVLVSARSPEHAHDQLMTMAEADVEQFDWEDNLNADADFGAVYVTHVQTDADRSKP